MSVIAMNRKFLIFIGKFHMTCVVFPLILKIKVKVEVAGYVENVHAIDEDHVEGHHGHQVEDG